MNSPTPEAQCVKDVFQIQSPVCDVYFSNNILIPQTRVNNRAATWFDLRHLLTINLKDKSLHYSKGWLGFIFSCVSQGTFFRFTLLKLLENTFVKLFLPLALSDHSAPCKTPPPPSPHKFDQKSFSSMKSFFKRKKSPHIFVGRRHYALSSYLFPFLKVWSLIFVVQTVAFQSKTT